MPKLWNVKTVEPHKCRSARYRSGGQGNFYLPEYLHVQLVWKGKASNMLHETDAFFRDEKITEMLENNYTPDSLETFQSRGFLKTGSFVERGPRRGMKNA